MELKVIKGGRDALEKQLIEHLFRPWAMDRRELEPVWERLAQKASLTICTPISSENEQSILRPAAE